MRKKKTLKELTIKDNFMFGAVMSDEENCRELLELILGVQIAKVEVSKEYNIVYHPEYKGVRLDVYAKDEKSTHYNVEMQAVSKVALGKRSRYYHSQMDMELLLSEREFKDEYVQKLQRDIQHIKQNREMEKRYMLFELEMRRERREGKAEGKAESVLELLQELGAVSEEVREKIINEKDGACLTRWLKLAAKAESVEQFLKEM